MQKLLQIHDCLSKVPKAPEPRHIPCISDTFCVHYYSVHNESILSTLQTLLPGCVAHSPGVGGNPTDNYVSQDIILL